MKTANRILFLMILSALCTACVDDTSRLGHSLVQSSFYNVSIDTCTVDISTIRKDSIVTRGDATFQIGHYRDSLWGDVYATYYAEVSCTSFTPNDNYSYALDSLVLRITHTGHYWGDTLATQRITAYRLSRPIELEDDDELYNHTVLPLEPEPLFSFTYNPRPGQKKEHEIRLPDALGQRLLNDLVAEAEYFDDQDKFRNHFPGLVFVPDDNGSCISGFGVSDSSLTITLHYEEISNWRTERELTFTINTDHAYTGIRHDPGNTPLNDMECGVENAVHSYATSHRAYLQGLTGFYSQIEFPYLNNFQDMGEIVSIESATLYLYPLSSSYGTCNQLPNEIRLYISDENNALEDYTYSESETTVQSGYLTEDEMFQRETYYSFDLTNFARKNFGTWGSRRQKLLLSLTDDDFSTTLNSVIFTNDPNRERQCRLDVRYKTYNEK